MSAEPLRDFVWERWAIQIFCSGRTKPGRTTRPCRSAVICQKRQYLKGLAVLFPDIIHDKAHFAICQMFL